MTSSALQAPRDCVHAPLSTPAGCAHAHALLSCGRCVPGQPGPRAAARSAAATRTHPPARTQPRLLDLPAALGGCEVDVGEGGAGSGREGWSCLR